MISSAFVPLEALPLTPNGKLDRQALPSPDGARQETATPFVPPATEVEHKLAAIFRELLGMNEIGVDDNFFDLGANSLMMVRVVEKIRGGIGNENVSCSCFSVSNVGQPRCRNRGCRDRTPVMLQCGQKRRVASFARK